MDGQSAEDHAVSVVLDGAVLVVSDDAGSVLARFPLADLSVSAMGEGSVAHLESTNAVGALLTLGDAGFLAELQGAGLRVRSTASGRRAVVVGLACFVGFAALMGGFYLAVPRLSESIAHQIPISTERALAPKMSMLLSGNTCHTAAADLALDRMVERLAPGQRGYVDVRIVNLGFANAFALPGSIVLLTRGLLEEAESADEVAGVLAHELAHVEHRHALSHMIRNALLGGLWIATLGDYSGMMIVDPKTAYETATLKYSREAEAEADTTALRTLTERHVSAAGLVKFLERNGKAESSDTTFLSSHPASADRVQRLSRQRLAGPEEPALDPDSLYELRKACERVKPVTTVRQLFDGR